jgi:hypothetical protein
MRFGKFLKHIYILLYCQTLQMNHASLLPIIIYYCFIWVVEKKRLTCWAYDFLNGNLPIQYQLD